MMDAGIQFKIQNSARQQMQRQMLQLHPGRLSNVHMHQHLHINGMPQATFEAVSRSLYCKLVQL